MVIIPFPVSCRGYVVNFNFRHALRLFHEYKYCSHEEKEKKNRYGYLNLYTFNHLTFHNMRNNSTARFTRYTPSTIFCMHYFRSYCSSKFT